MIGNFFKEHALATFEILSKPQTIKNAQIALHVLEYVRLRLLKQMLRPQVLK